MRTTFKEENHIIQYTFVLQSEVIGVLMGDSVLNHALFGCEQSFVCVCVFVS